jgi:hypothetical protein
MKNVGLIILLTFLCLLIGATMLYAGIVKAPGFKPYETDTSIKIEFKIPAGMFEDTQSAKESELYKIFLPQGETLDSSPMALAVNCQLKSRQVSNLDSFIKYNVDHFKALYPNMKVSIINLPKDVTAKIDSLNISYYTLLLKSNSDADISDNLVMFFETKKGLWSITYIAPEKAINEMRNIFLSFIKNTEITNNE